MFQHIHRHPDGLRAGGQRRVLLHRVRFGRGRVRILPVRDAVQRLDQTGVVTRLLLPCGTDLPHDHLHAVDCLQDQCDDGRTGGEFAIAYAAEHILRCVGHTLQPREAEETAGALDRVHQPEHQGQRLLVLRYLLQPNQGDVEVRQILVGLRQEIGKQIVHPDRPSARRDGILFGGNKQTVNSKASQTGMR